CPRTVTTTSLNVDLGMQSDKFFFFQAEDGIRDKLVTGVQTCALRSHRFGPPLGVTPASPCSWVDRPGFGSAPAYCWIVFATTHALVTGLAFAPAPPATGLAMHARSNSPDHNAKGTQSDVL